MNITKLQLIAEQAETIINLIQSKERLTSELMSFRNRHPSKDVRDIAEQKDAIAPRCAELEAENQDLRDEHRKQIDAIEMSEQALRDELDQTAASLSAKERECSALLAEASAKGAEIIRLRSYIAGNAATLSARDKTHALENVLAKLREFVDKNIGNADDTPLLPSMKGDWLTVGDLRRWVDSEVKP